MVCNSRDTMQRAPPRHLQGVCDLTHLDLVPYGPFRQMSRLNYNSLLECSLPRRNRPQTLALIEPEVDSLVAAQGSRARTS
jgi:hypothetical protein